MDRTPPGTLRRHVAELQAQALKAQCPSRRLLHPVNMIGVAHGTTTIDWLSTLEGMNMCQKHPGGDKPEALFASDAEHKAHMAGDIMATPNAGPKPSAMLVAMQRAAHQLLDRPGIEAPAS